MKKKYRHIFFDFDNTLWDFESNSKEALNEVFEKYCLDNFFVDFEQFYSFYVPKNRELWELYPRGLITRKQLDLERFLHPLLQVGHHDEELAIRLSNDYLEICPTKTNLMPHAVELLQYLEADYNSYIITNGLSAMQEIKIKSCGIGKYIKKIFLSENIGYYKPDRRIFEYALKSSNAKKNESIMIGDNFNADIVGAKNIGMHQIYLNPDKTETLPFLPTYNVQSLAEIKNIL